MRVIGRRGCDVDRELSWSWRRARASLYSDRLLEAVYNTVTAHAAVQLCLPRLIFMIDSMDYV